MTSAMPELGSKISLISKQLGIRYQGTLVAFDAQKNTIALMNVLSFGTENRDTQFPVVPQNQVYEYILFRASDIRDIRVVDSMLLIPNDPAIIKMTVQQAPIGQQTYQMMPGMAGPASSIPGFPGAYPMSVGGGGGGHIMMANNARPQNQHVYNHSVTDVLDLSGSGGGGGGGSRSKTPPPSLTASKSPSIGQPTYQMIPTPNNPHSMMPGMAGPASSIPGFPGAYPMSMGGGGGGHNMMANNARPQNQHIMNNNQINKAPSELNPASG
ncbi:protein LSM14 homolog A-like [Aphidius gifuensis]|uniref:protein LSM14 homolog A-like n=1 Tax=Aphidius gifuensis TaxID=684658 RepID=UPI001CDB59BD|nr:protein LSM14 homolog A-like [Aphidius gifuensis]